MTQRSVDETATQSKEEDILRDLTCLVYDPEPLDPDAKLQDLC